jgi:hypothetical protein
MMHKCSYTFICYTLAIFCYTQRAEAQCNHVTVGITVTQHATCLNNGAIIVTLSGADTGNLDMSTALYTLTPTSGTPISTAAPGGVITTLPPGTYGMKVSALCTVSHTTVEWESALPVTINNEYTEMNVSFGAVRKTFNCQYTGLIPLLVSGGKAPYTISMTGKPNTYTGQTSLALIVAGTLNVENLPAGSYTFIAADSCGTTLSRTAPAVGTFVADFVPEMIGRYVFMPATPDSTDCSKIRIDARFSSSHELYEIFNAGFYEIGFVYNGNATTQPTSWKDLIPPYIDYQLAVDRDDFRKNNDHVSVWLRIKGASNCAPQKVRDVKAINTTIVSVLYTWVNCNTALIKHRLMGTDIYNIFCYPIQYCVVNPSTSPVDTIIPWSERFTHHNYIETEMPYGSQIVYRDAKGNLYKQAIATSALNMEAGYTSFGCDTPNVSGYYNSHTALMVSGGGSGSIPAGTRVEVISGPMEPFSRDFTTTSTTPYIYPYSTTGNYAAQGQNEYMLPGKYTFKLTLPGGGSCAEKTVSFYPEMYRLVTPLSISRTRDTCEGQWIFPVGQLSFIRSTESNTATWFSIESAPQGVTFSRTGVQAGDSLLLQVPGRYVIKLTNRQKTDPGDFCISDTIHYVYEKKPLALDANATSAYVCPGSTTGYIHVEGINGFGAYTYELRKQNGDFVDSNTSGEFLYGSAGEVCTVRVTDGCGNSSAQSITIRDLSDVKLTYSSGGPSKDVFCEGQILQLHCVTLNTATYHWTGPNGWSYTGQHPAIPNTTPVMSGDYTVSVTPAGCSVKTETIHITVSPCTVPVNPHLRSRVIQ